MTLAINEIEMIFPIGDRVLVQRVKYPEAHKSGLLIITSAKKKENLAVIIQIGSGDKISQAGYKVGDIVLMDGYAGQPVFIGDEEHIVARLEDVLALVKLKE